MKSKVKSDYRQRAYDYYRTITWEQSQRISTMNIDARVQQYRRRWGRFLPEDKDVPILDLGCGGREFSYFLQQEDFTNLRGVDMSLEQMEAVRELNLQNVKLASGDYCWQVYTENMRVVARKPRD